MANQEIKLEIIREIELLGNEAGEFVDGDFFPCGRVQEIIDRLDQAVDKPQR